MNSATISEGKSTKSVNVRFRLPYIILSGGQSLLVCGSGQLLGSWNVKEGLLMAPVHEGDELIWYGSIAVSMGYECEYSHYVVDDDRNVVRWEMGNKRKLFLADSIHGAGIVELRDLWQVMQELGLVGLRIQRMPSEPGLEFGIPSQYSYITVCSPSCHDSSTLRAWWEEDEERRQRYFKTVVGSELSPPGLCVPDLVHFVIRQHVESPSMWAIFPLQDLLALKEEYTTRPAAEETINDPTNPKHYGRYRVHVTLESLLKDDELKTTIKDVIGAAGRSHPRIEVETVPGTTRLATVVNGNENMALLPGLNGVPYKETVSVVL